MSDAIIVALISAGIPTVATAISAYIQRRLSIRNAAKSDILQMIIEDKVAVMEGHLPTNYQNILDAYQKYHNHGGDEYITGKKEDYQKWFKKIEGAKHGRKSK